MLILTVSAFLYLLHETSLLTIDLFHHAGCQPSSRSSLRRCSSLREWISHYLLRCFDSVLGCKDWSITIRQTYCSGAQFRKRNLVGSRQQANVHRRKFPFCFYIHLTAALFALIFLSVPLLDSAQLHRFFFHCPDSRIGGR
jgi:hypothetical protein